MFVLSSKTVARMELHDKFRREIYKEYNLRPVFRIKDAWAQVRYEKEDKVAMFNGMPIRGISYRILTDEEILEKNPNLPTYPTNEETDEYLDIQDRWIAEQMLARFDWFTFEEEVARSSIKNKDAFVKAHCACGGADKQCTFLCPQYPCWSVEAF